HQPLAVGTEHRQHVRSRRVRQTHFLARIDVHPVEIVIRPARYGVIGGGVDDVLAVLVAVRGPLYAVRIVRRLPLTAALGVYGIELETIYFLAIAAEDDALAIGREERAAVVAARRVRQLADVLAVLVHDVQFKVFRASAIGAEDDLLAVGRVAALGVVAGRVGQALQAAAVGIGLEDVEVGVEVPL